MVAWCVLCTVYHDMCRHAPLQSHSDRPQVLIITVIITLITLIIGFIVTS